METVSLNGKTCFVTGAGGFIGSHLAERLVEEGARVRALVHYNALGARGWLDESPLAKDMEIIAGDITDAWSVREAMRGSSHVFHLAALIAIPYSYAAPSSYVRTNVEGTLNVLQAARELGVTRVVHTSTSEVYGTARYAPIDEAHPLQGQSPYSASKIGADKLAEAYACSFELPVVTLRPFNTFGPRQSARAVIPTIISQCLSGGVVRLGSVHPTRDMNFVDDTVSGFVAAATAAGVDGEVVHLGTGRELSIGDLAALIAQRMGKEIRIESESLRQRPAASEVERLVASPEKAIRLLGWSPAWSLEEGVDKTIDWMRENLRRYRPAEYST
jgi:NAD dependent epimerase/dehydratase